MAVAKATKNRVFLVRLLKFVSYKGSEDGPFKNSREWIKSQGGVTVLFLIVELSDPLTNSLRNHKSEMSG